MSSTARHPFKIFHITKDIVNLHLIRPHINARRLSNKRDEKMSSTARHPFKIFHTTKDIVILHLIRPHINARGLSNKRDQKMSSTARHPFKSLISRNHEGHDNLSPSARSGICRAPRDTPLESFISRDDMIIFT